MHLLSVLKSARLRQDTGCCVMIHQSQFTAGNDVEVVDATYLGVSPEHWQQQSRNIQLGDGLLVATI